MVDVWQVDEAEKNAPSYLIRDGGKERGSGEGREIDR
jgi:hypothetical protein